MAIRSPPHPHPSPLPTRPCVFLTTHRTRTFAGPTTSPSRRADEPDAPPPRAAQGAAAAAAADDGASARVGRTAGRGRGRDREPAPGQPWTHAARERSHGASLTLRNVVTRTPRGGRCDRKLARAPSHHRRTQLLLPCGRRGARRRPAPRAPSDGRRASRSTLRRYGRRRGPTPRVETARTGAAVKPRSRTTSPLPC